jgi:hypothetical protein
LHIVTKDRGLIYMVESFITNKDIEDQEIFVKEETEKCYGKNIRGFCDFALDGIELLMQGVQLWEPDATGADGKYKDFKTGLRTNAFLHFYRTSFAFKATYNLTVTGYYNEASILLRSIVESFVKLRYVELSKTEEYLYTSIAGHVEVGGKKFNVRYIKQFDTVAPGLYYHYRTLCDMAHGNIASIVFKTDVVNDTLQFHNGIIFHEMNSIFVTNQFSVYLLAHLEYMTHIFPEVKKKMPNNIQEKYHKTLSILWKMMGEIEEKDKNQKWYNAIKKLVEFT